MKKLLLCLMLLVCLSLSACSKSDTGIPDDLVVVLPDGQELYLYMPHDDAAEILGAADSVDNIMGKWYNYDGLSLTVVYKDELLAYISLKEDSLCQLKSGISPSSGKSDFIKAGFSSDKVAHKYYKIKDGHYNSSDTDLEDVKFQSGAVIRSGIEYERADDPSFEGYPIVVSDLYCGRYGGFDGYIKDSSKPISISKILQETAPVPDPIVYTGYGKSKIYIEHPDSFSVFYITASMPYGTFQINGCDENGLATMFTGTVSGGIDSNYSGLTIDSIKHPTSYFEITASGDWSIEVRSVRTCRIATVGDIVTGNGDDVIILDGTPNTAHIIGNAAGNNFSVSSCGDQWQDLLVSTLDVYDDTMELRSDTLILAVQAIGDWTIEIK